MPADIGGGVIAVGVKRVCTAEKRFGLVMVIKPVKAHPVTQIIVAVVAVEIPTAFIPLHRGLCQIFVIFPTVKTFDAIAFADVVGGFKIERFGSKSFSQSRRLSG